jgi:hypothetical protein
MSSKEGKHPTLRQVFIQNGGINKNSVLKTVAHSKQAERVTTDSTSVFLLSYYILNGAKDIGSKNIYSTVYEITHLQIDKLH